ncbi:MAG: DUF2520 domain-containing protein [Bacteroidetes bacterium]|nr:DUF2520 domain-containing protein [Bacteroidota bacterium]MBU1719561.1 DUF2520 domain-containing protein [Bacteroidota bacterium]
MSNFPADPVFVVGSGNLARNFLLKFRDIKIPVHGFLARNKTLAKKIEEETGFPAFDHTKDIPGNTSFCFLAVSDQAISEVASGIPPISGILIHHSGTTDIEAIQCVRKKGVIWPLQSLTAYSHLNWNEIPLMIEGSDKDVLNEIQKFASLLSPIVEEADSARRVMCHLAAVFSNNFVNHLIAVAFDIAKSEGIDPTLLIPLIQETLKRVQSANPADLQTGPAIRNDQPTIARHQELLSQHPEYQQLYNMLTSDIIRYRNINTTKK